MKDKEIVLMGYSGHAFVVADAIIKSGQKIAGYCEPAESHFNPFQLKYLGFEAEDACKQILKQTPFIIGIGDNYIRERMTNALSFCEYIATVIHPAAIIGSNVKIESGTVVLAGCVINALSQIGHGVICNTGSIIEHEANIGDYSHIAPGAVLAGNVTIGKRSFIGANAVIKQGVTIGNDVIVGAGAVVLSNVEDGLVVVGNPAKRLVK